MDPLHRLEAKSLARAKVRAKRRRVRAIRARSIVGSLVLFAVAWGIVFGQLVTGNDPVLSRSAARPVASIHRRSRAAATQRAAPSEEGEAPPEAPAVETETEAAPEEIESAPEPEAAPEEIEVAPEPEPAPVITSAS